MVPLYHRYFARYSVWTHSAKKTRSFSLSSSLHVQMRWRILQLDFAADHDAARRVLSRLVSCWHCDKRHLWWTIEKVQLDLQQRVLQFRRRKRCFWSCGRCDRRKAHGRHFHRSGHTRQSFDDFHARQREPRVSGCRAARPRRAGDQLRRHHALKLVQKQPAHRHVLLGIFHAGYVFFLCSSPFLILPLLNVSWSICSRPYFVLFLLYFLSLLEEWKIFVNLLKFAQKNASFSIFTASCSLSSIKFTKQELHFEQSFAFIRAFAFYFRFTRP